MVMDFLACDGHARGPVVQAPLGVWGAEPRQPGPRGRWAHHPSRPCAGLAGGVRSGGVQAAQAVSCWCHM